jgi:hypothetical protein
MPILQEWDLAIGVDQVLRGQGADPEAIRSRRPTLVSLAERALAESTALIKPKVLYRSLEVESLQHQRLVLSAGAHLAGELISQHLAAAERVIVMLCTIGSGLEELASHHMQHDMLYGLALDGLGSAAVETLANAACSYIEKQAEAEGINTTIPLSPGMIGWTVAEGQKQVFRLLDGSQIGVHLMESRVMIPKKSVSIALGLGADALQEGRACDYCSMKETCRYQDHYG